jgi:hypothetical protein
MIQGVGNAAGEGCHRLWLVAGISEPTTSNHTTETRGYGPS